MSDTTNQDVIIKARKLHKTYNNLKVVNDVDFNVSAGQVLGVIGPNGAGKTTLLKALLGLIPIDGQLEVLDLEPRTQRTQLLEDVCFIADTAILPRWMKVSQALDYVDGVHQKFNREKAESFLKSTTIKLSSKIRHLSKGMVTQLHLALVMAIDAKLLVLDEPTLGLDIIHRKEFYSTLLTEYYDKNKTIIITTHQVEEIQNILTDVMFIDQGSIILKESMEDIPSHYIAVDVDEENIERARALSPLSEQRMLGSTAMIFRTNNTGELETLGKTKNPDIADLFLATVKQNVANQGEKS